MEWQYMVLVVLVVLVVISITVCTWSSMQMTKNYNNFKKVNTFQEFDTEIYYNDKGWSYVRQGVTLLEVNFTLKEGHDERLSNIIFDYVSNGMKVDVGFVEYQTLAHLITEDVKKRTRVEINNETT